ncbi:MAG: hypothetical protein WAW69_07075 [Polaromonas sp.]
MKLNIFEGARRIALGLGVIWLTGWLAFAVLSKPYASMTYAVEWPGQPATKVESCAKEDATEYVAVKTAKGGSVRVTLCLTAHEATDGRLLVPFSVEPFESKIPPIAKLKPVEGNPWDNDTIVTSEKQKALASDLPPTSALQSMSDADLIAAYQKANASSNLPSSPAYIMNEKYSSEVIKYGLSIAARFSLSQDGMKVAEQTIWDARLKQWKEALQIALGGIAALWAAVAGIGWIVRGFMGIPRGKDTRPAG